MYALEKQLQIALAGDSEASFLYRLHEEAYFDAEACRKLLQACLELAEFYQTGGPSAHYPEMARLILDRLAYTASLIFCHYAPHDGFRITNMDARLENAVIPEFFAAAREISARLIL